MTTAADKQSKRKAIHLKTAKLLVWMTVQNIQELGLTTEAHETLVQS